MKKANRKPADDLRPEYKRSDLGTLVRGKYAQRAAEASNVVVLEPKVAEAFPNDRAVNKALRGLLRTRKRTARASPRGTRPPRTPRRLRLSRRLLRASCRKRGRTRFKRLTELHLQRHARMAQPPEIH